MSTPFPLPDGLRFVDAVKEEHFRAMSLIHALGWRDTYVGYVPQDFLDREITDERWVPFFQEDFDTGRCHGLLLYNGDLPVAAINYGPARTENYNAGVKEGSDFPNEAYQGWGEIISFYSRPDQRGKGYGGLLFEEAVRRLKEAGHENAFVFVLRENEGGRRFYAAHGFAWDGTHADIPYPPNAICVDLRYVKKL